MARRCLPFFAKLQYYYWNKVNLGSHEEATEATDTIRKTQRVNQGQGPRYQLPEQKNAEC